MNKDRCLLPATDDECRKAWLTLHDTLDIVGGKWKLVLISILRGGKMKFRELAKEAGISPRILSKELKELEANGLVSRTVLDTRPISVEYELTAYSVSLNEVISTMYEWGQMHRQKITGKV
ncbi:MULTISPECIES: helix-turn-helix domain-containing protein [unclassified Sphingobacterium]|uniref:winged helix-turn-helix transcriptional regulator n=1 Tax=unclassified Sphingobacterium TaxID=2609468 RepID=UPI001438FE8C|nr:MULTISPECIES: helix-turn-helix domain-containing protein [unclassified Sphingobacterium]MBB2950214.1 DNA-binding HxlR family transcriptional regulator [Sphingobacterium sp. JUb56]NJI73157.1 helix-turn-helix transcriptional regulator [Sphingobacterium sp. B16(2022)]